MSSRLSTNKNENVKKETPEATSGKMSLYNALLIPLEFI